MMMIGIHAIYTHALGYRTVNCTGGGLLNEKIMSGSTLFGENIFASVRQGCITNGQWYSTVIGHIPYGIWQVEYYFWARIER